MGKTLNIALVLIAAFGAAIFLTWILSPFTEGSFSIYILIFYGVTIAEVLIPLITAGILGILHKYPNGALFLLSLGFLLLFFNVVVLWVPLLRTPYF